MNLIFHFLFNYLFVDLVFGRAWDYVVVILIFSVLIDLTHIPYLLKVKGEVVRKRFGSESRTRFHEMYGLTIFSFMLWLAYFIADQSAVSVAALCLVLHFSLDFISGKSAPFYPFSKKEVNMGMLPYGYKERIIFEILATFIAGVFFWLGVQSLVL